MKRIRLMTLHALLSQVRMIAISINDALTLDGHIVHLQPHDQHATGIPILAQQKGLIERLDVGRVGIVIGTALDRGALCQSQGDIVLEEERRGSILPGGEQHHATAGCGRRIDRLLDTGRVFRHAIGVGTVVGNGKHTLGLLGLDCTNRKSQQNNQGTHSLSRLSSSVPSTSRHSVAVFGSAA